MTEASKPRIYKYDNVKLLAIILVVIAGFAEEFTFQSDLFRSWFLFSSSFTAPLFVFLSGLFQKQYDPPRKLNVQKITFYLLLGVLLKLITTFVRASSGDPMWVDYLLGGVGMEWYLFVVAGYMLTMYLLRRVNRYVMLAVSVVIGVAAGFLPIGDFFYVMRFLVFLPFYVAGYHITPIKVRRFTHRLNVKLAGIAFIFIYFVLCFREREILYPLESLFTGSASYIDVAPDGLNFWHRLLCYGISAVLIISVMACMPNRKFPVLTRMGQNTLGVYFWHYPIILLLRYTGMTEMFLQLGDPLWKYAMIVAAAGLAILLSLSIFSIPLKKLGTLIDRVPTKACIITDLIMIATVAILLYIIPIIIFSP